MPDFVGIYSASSKVSHSQEWQRISSRIPVTSKVTEVGDGARWSGVVYRRPGYDAEKIYQASSGRGAIIGNLFNSAHMFTPAQGDILLESVTEHIVSSRGAYLANSCWGRYIAALAGTDNSSVLLVRDPTGIKRLFYCSHEGDVYFASDVSLLVDLLGETASIDWEYVRAYLRYRGFLPTPRTGFKGIRELMPGESLLMTPRGNSTHTYWSLAKIGELRTDDTRLLHEELQSVLNSTIGNWASTSGRVAILLSGGLDSSSVLANLVNFKPAKDIVCINLFSSDADLDERAYARAACEHLGVKLHELAFEDTDVNAGGQESQYRTARPNGRSLVSVLDKKILRVASDAGCNSIWSGNAGDAVLYQNLSPELIGDLYIDRGLCSALRYAGSIASFKNRTLWGILAEAYKSVDRKAIEGKVEIPLDDLTESILTNVPDTDGSIFSHAVPAGFNDVERPGKAEHIVSIYRSAYDSQELFLAPEYAPFNVVNPFVSQPLLEWAVRIPVYRFYGKEGTRAPLRKILSRSLPKRVAFRNIKGEGGGPVMRYITRSSDKVLARLSNGALTQQQILNIAAVQKLLEDQTKIANGNLVELIGPLAVEAWRSSWSEVRNG